MMSAGDNSTSALNHIAVEKRAVSAVEVNELEVVAILDPDCSVTATDIFVSRRTEDHVAGRIPSNGQLDEPRQFNLVSLIRFYAGDMPDDDARCHRTALSETITRVSIPHAYARRSKSPSRSGH